MRVRSLALLPLLAGAILATAGCEDKAPAPATRTPAVVVTAALPWLCEYRPGRWLCASPPGGEPMRGADGWACHRSAVEVAIWVCEHKVLSESAPVTLPTPHTIRRD